MSDKLEPVWPDEELEKEMLADADALARRDSLLNDDSACHIKALLQRVRDLEEEVARLKRGDFSPEEFQSLCHHRDEKPDCTPADFDAGCQEYRKKLFGERV